MKEKREFNFEEQPVKPYKSEEELLAETIERIKATNKKRGIKPGIQPLDPKMTDSGPKYKNER